MTALRILVLGAHPDDADIRAGGTCAKWVQHGFEVLLVSVTDGGAGHQTLRRPELVQRRRAEATAAGAILGAEYRVLDLPDGALLPTLEARNVILRLIREFRPDLVITHRIADYHPDHRYTSQLVQDAAYMVTVPAVCPDIPHLEQMPVILYFSDDFKRPNPFDPQVVVDISAEFEVLLRMLDCHVSQFYEWLPFNGAMLDQVPKGQRERLDWLSQRFRQRIGPLAERFRPKILEAYGEEAGSRIELIDAFEVSEYGSALGEAKKAMLFPFLPRTTEPPKQSSKYWPDTKTT